MRILHLLSAFAVAALAMVSSAQATVIYSFSNLTMTTSMAGDPTMYLSGSFAIPNHSFGPLSNLTSAWHTPLAAVDLTVTDGAAFTRSFTDPTYFMYQDGLAVNGHYLVSIGPNAFMPLLDAYWDQIFITIDQNVLVTDGEFSTITYSRGFSTYSFVNGVNQNNTVPARMQETSSVPEPPMVFLFLAGVALVVVTSMSRPKQANPLSFESA